jgi:hypothetical protein
MPILASESVETTSNDLHEEQTSVQIKDVKDGNTFLVFLFLKFECFFKN